MLEEIITPLFNYYQYNIFIIIYLLNIIKD